MPTIEELMRVVASHRDSHQKLYNQITEKLEQLEPPRYIENYPQIEPSLSSFVEELNRIKQELLELSELPEPPDPQILEDLHFRLRKNSKDLKYNITNELPAEIINEFNEIHTTLNEFLAFVSEDALNHHDIDNEDELNHNEIAIEIPSPIIPAAAEQHTSILEILKSNLEQKIFQPSTYDISNIHQTADGKSLTISKKEDLSDNFKKILTITEKPHGGISIKSSPTELEKLIDTIKETIKVMQYAGKLPKDEKTFIITFNPNQIAFLEELIFLAKQQGLTPQLSQYTGNDPEALAKHQFLLSKILEEHKPASPHPPQQHLAEGAPEGPIKNPLAPRFANKAPTQHPPQNPLAGPRWRRREIGPNT